jgi:Ribose 5-phosphate isomerase A (phosphoriboisomerase A)
MSTAGADRDALKRAAADAAAELVRDGMRVGLGTGSTAAFELEALARRHRQGLRFVGIPTSEQTAARATALGSPLTSLTPRLLIDLTIDGAHEVERGTLNLIKGLGGALLPPGALFAHDPRWRRNGIEHCSKASASRTFAENYIKEGESMSHRTPLVCLTGESYLLRQALGENLVPEPFVS